MPPARLTVRRELRDTAVGTDFTGEAGTLTFAPGSTSATVKVAVTADIAAGGDEVFTATRPLLSRPYTVTPMYPS